MSILSIKHPSYVGGPISTPSRARTDSVPEESVPTYPLEIRYGHVKYHRMVHRKLLQTTHEKQYLRKNGSFPKIRLERFLRRDTQGERRRLICITAEVDKVVGHLSVQDFLADLPNRAGSDDYFQGVLENAFRERRWLRNVLLNMDAPKNIDDTYGNGAGDRAKVHFAKHRRAAVLGEYQVARKRGNVFVIVLGDVLGRADIDATFQLALLTQPLEVSSTAIDTT